VPFKKNKNKNKKKDNNNKMMMMIMMMMMMTIIEVCDCKNNLGFILQQAFTQGRRTGTHFK
jgi:hypothetical protein